MYEPDIDVSQPLAASLIARRFPEFAGSRVEPFGGGMDNHAFLVDEAWVFRFPRRSKIAELLGTECAILPRIAGALPVPISTPRYVAEPDCEFPWHFAGYALIDGTALRPHAANEERTALAPQLGAFLRALHAVDTAPCVAAGLKGDYIGRMDPVRRVPMARERLEELRRDGAVDGLEPLLRILVDDAPVAAPQRRTIAHGDLYASHLIVSCGELAGVVDWGDLHLGDPAVDIAVAHEVLPRGAHVAFRDAYGGVDEETWRRARWRAVVHASLVAHFGARSGKAGLFEAGLWSLKTLATVDEGGVY